MSEKLQEIKRNTLTGLFLVAPIIITLWILNAAFLFFTDFVVGILPDVPRSSIIVMLYRLSALILLLFVLYLIGLLTRNIFGKSLYRMFDNIIARLPVVGAIYKSVRQVSESIFTSRNTMFREVVLVEFPSTGLYSIGFLTAPVSDLMAKQVDATKPEDVISVFVPTSPNPTTGFLLLLKRHQIKTLPLNVADAMKMIMSVGAVSGRIGNGVSTSLLDHVEEWTKKASKIEEKEHSNKETTNL